MILYMNAIRMLNIDLNGLGSHDAVTVGPFHLQTYTYNENVYFILIIGK